jgi:hypothetical protein
VSRPGRAGAPDRADHPASGAAGGAQRQAVSRALSGCGLLHAPVDEAIGVPYLGEMPIRLSALLALAVSACGFQSGSAPEASPELDDVDQPVINTCEPRNYPCNPFDRFANGVCQIICGGDGYCLDYSAVEYAWCARHPDQFFGPGKWCMPNGDPYWQTRCLPGFLP